MSARGELDTRTPPLLQVECLGRIENDGVSVRLGNAGQHWA
jgi:hypothetical protein